MKLLSVYLSLMSRMFAGSILLPTGIMFLSNGYVNAQIASDGSLNTTISQNGNNFTITNGTAVGSNLFHSFSLFSVPTGGSAFFNNPTTIENIFARVTGGSTSNLDGLIRANGTANLFLLNSAGIMFGPNTQLNIGGSFIGSTANNVIFADGTKFSTIDATSAPLLTMSVPVGLQLGANAGAIQVQGADLRVKTGQTLALVGSQIDMTGAKLTAPNGHIELWAVQNAGIQMENQAQWQLTSPVATTNWGTITYTTSFIG
jgi:filamentous hemagglutinin family protein